jgi:cytoskeletal protein CcmA (bactofilin family)
MENDHLQESGLTIIAPDIHIDGKVQITRELHLFGKISGEVLGKEGSLLILKEGSLVEGRIRAATLIVDGFAKGEIEATQRVWVTSRGKVSGSVKTPSLQVDPGAVFEAKVLM